MTLDDILRVCDDAERWNAQNGWASCDSGFRAIDAVRRSIKESSKDWKGMYGVSIIEPDKK